MNEYLADKMIEFMDRCEEYMPNFRVGWIVLFILITGIPVYLWFIAKYIIRWVFIKELKELK